MGTTGAIFFLVLMLVVGVFLLVCAAGYYNQLVQNRERVREAWSEIDVQLTRRHDLIPNLVRTAERYGVVERDTLEGVMRARKDAVGAQTVDNRAAAESELTQFAARFFAVAEAYPQLKVDQHFLNLQSSWASTEDRIAAARSAYNNAVREHNTTLDHFPQLLVGVLLFFRKARYYEPRHTSKSEVATAPSI